MRAAFFVTSFRHLGQRSPSAIPAVSAPHRTQGWLEPPNDGTSEFAGRSTAPQVLRPDVVLHDDSLEGASHPASRLELAAVAKSPPLYEHMPTGMTHPRSRVTT